MEGRRSEEKRGEEEKGSGRYADVSVVLGWGGKRARQADRRLCLIGGTVEG